MKIGTEGYIIVEYQYGPMLKKCKVTGYEVEDRTSCGEHQTIVTDDEFFHEKSKGEKECRIRDAKFQKYEKGKKFEAYKKAKQLVKDYERHN